MTETSSIFELIEYGARVPTWFRIGGGADMLVKPRNTDELRDVLVAFASEQIRVLGDGANLLVKDEGVGGLVISLAHLNTIEEIEQDNNVFLRVGAGMNLPKLIVQTVRNGLAGLEGLAGIPATVGGAVRMNAGGAFGEIGDLVHEVHAISHLGEPMTIPANQTAFGYRSSGLEYAIITSVVLRLVRVPEDERATLRERLKEAMAYKKKTQPMADQIGRAHV